MEIIKKIWSGIVEIWNVIWFFLLIAMVLFSIWSSWKHAMIDKELEEEKTRTTMHIGALITENILQRPGYDGITRKQLDSIYLIESERVIKNVYKK